MLCPLCKVPLLLTERQGIEIDYCGQCRGVWLDRGELEKLIERSQAYETAPRRTDDSFRDTSHDGFKKGKYDARHPHRKRSFLSDLLDFD